MTNESRHRATKVAFRCDNRPVVRGSLQWGAARSAVSGVPLPLRYALVGGAVLGGIGGLVGLVIGLWAYPPTAWFAIFEVGVPAGVLGAVLGLAAGSIAHLLSKRSSD